jgi:hypothetical protein
MTDTLAVSITGINFKLPENAPNDGMYVKLTYPVMSDFTTGSITGDGAFDSVMTGVNAQLANQYDAGRITGAEYTKAYIAMIQTALQTALQYILQKDNAYWSSQQAQIAAITGRIQMEKARYEYAAAQFNVNNILPMQLTLITEQAEVQHAQTSDKRIDGTTNIAGLIGQQKSLYAQQITSYQRDAEVKAAKLFSDAWTVQKTMDEGLLAPDGFTNTSLDMVLTKVKTNNGFV